MIGEVVAGWTMRAADVSIEIYGTEGTALVSGVDLAGEAIRNPPGCGSVQEERSGSSSARTSHSSRVAAFTRPSPAHMSAF